MTAKEFLADHEHVIRWSTTDKVPTGLGLDLVFIGPGEHGLEVAVAHSPSRPRVVYAGTPEERGCQGSRSLNNHPRQILGGTIDLRGSSRADDQTVGW